MPYPNYCNPMLNNNNNNMAPSQMMGAQYLPRMQVIKVNGEAGARNLRMAPNSSALVLDETAPIVWYAQTDGTGYLTVTPFDIHPHENQPPVNLNDLLQRVNKLEEEMVNVQQSNFGSTKQAKRKQPAVEPTMDATS